MASVRILPQVPLIRLRRALALRLLECLVVSRFPEQELRFLGMASVRILLQVPLIRLRRTLALRLLECLVVLLHQIDQLKNLLESVGIYLALSFFLRLIFYTTLILVLLYRCAGIVSFVRVGAPVKEHFHGLFGAGPCRIV